MNDTTPSNTENQVKQTILIVDDEPVNLAVLTHVLQPHYRVRATRSSEEALRAAATSPRPDLVLLDIMMPEMDGFGVLAKLRENPELRAIPVLFVTALSDEISEERGLEGGAVDYITKPIKPSIVRARVRTQLELKAARDALAHQNSLLEAEVADRTKALKMAVDKAESAHAVLKKTYLGTLQAIGTLAELRGSGIGEHCRRVADLARQVAQRMGLGAAEVQDIFVAALLHDIGKIGFPDGLLEKPVSTMSSEQLALYRQHPAMGADVLRKIDGFTEIAAIVRHHHEHFDGTGFPDGKSGLDIPLGARIICAANDYDSLKYGNLTAQPLSSKQSKEFLLDRRGGRYDPNVINKLEPLIAYQGQFEIDEIRISPTHLREGMVLTRDVRHPDGYLLLSKNTVITRSLIDQLVAVIKQTGIDIKAYVNREPVSATSPSSPDRPN
jgi:putative two-component system response regulator